MGRTLLAVLVIAAVLLVVVWAGWKLGGWATRTARKRHLETAEEKAIWHPFRRVNDQGLWEIGLEKRYKNTVLQTIYRGPTLPLDTDTGRLLELEGEAISAAGRLNET